MTDKKTVKTLLHCIIACVILLCTIGLIFVYSSSSVFALERYGSASYFAKKHLMGLIIGLIAGLMVQVIPLETIKRTTPLAFYVSLLLTLCTLMPGLSHKIHGSQRWLSLGSFSFQPSELLKITLVLYLAYLLTPSKLYRRWATLSFTQFIIILVCISVILLKQPDFGLTITLVVTGCIMLFIARLHSKQLLITTAALIPLAGVLVVLKPYRLKRILIFLNPWDDPQGAGFQIIQSLIAIGSGGLTGVGISNSKQKFFYLPMQHTDFIFSIIAEETGFIGSVIIILLYAFLLYTGLRLAWQLHDPFCSYATLGFIIVINLQAIINLCVTTGLVPTKGIGLPFISYGNTALLCSILMVGLIIHFSRHALFQRN
jgi:cell division protein FtsW